MRCDGVLLGKLARHRQLVLGECISMYVLNLEVIFEHNLLQYPGDCLRASVHSLPVSGGVLAARRVFSTWHCSMGGNGNGNASTPAASTNERSNGNHRGSPHTYSKGAGGWHRGRKQSRGKGGERQDSERRRASRRKPSTSSSSSSTSSGSKCAWRIKKAARCMAKHSDTYREYMEQKRTELRNKELRAQGEALAQAMQSTFQDT